MSSENSSVFEFSTWQTNTTGSTYETASNVSSPLNKDPLISLTVPAIMFASGVFGNLLAILVLARSSRDHKQTVFYRLVGALAITDLFGTCATSPVTLAVYANNLKWVGGEHLCNYESFMFVFVSCTPIFIIGTMAMDRVFAISFPFFYETHITYSRAKWYILGLWGFAALMGSLPLFGLGEVKKQFPGTWCFFTFTSEKVKNQIFAYGYACIGLFVIGLTGVANIMVTLILLKMRRAMSRTMGNTKRNDSELQMMVLMLGVIIVFATCWCPFLIRILINQASFRQVDVKADLHALRLASLNQILDPWVYILFRRTFFKKLYVFIRVTVFGLCKRSPSSSISPNKSAKQVKARYHQAETGNTSTAHAQDDASETVPLDQRNGNIHDPNNVTSATTHIDDELSESSLQSSGDSNSQLDEETLFVNHPHEHHHHHHGLELKHTACLFCLSKLPHDIAYPGSDESESMDKLKFKSRGHRLAQSARITGGRDALAVKDGRGKRKSLHLSLEDVRRN